MFKIHPFRFFIILLLITVSSQITKAQIGYFVYLQSEGSQPFYTILNKKTHSSSSIGHLILPALENGTYDITIGFPNNNNKQEYRITVKENDLGFLIKKVDGAEQFGLLNLQTASVQLAGSMRQQAEVEKQKAAEAEALAQKQAEEAKILEQQRAEAQKKVLEEEAARKKAAEAVALQNKNEVETATTEAGNQPKSQVDSANVETAAKKDNEADAALALKKKQDEEIRKYNEERRAMLLKEEAAKKEAEAKVAIEEEQNKKETTTSEKQLTPAEIAKLMEEARKIDAKGKRDSVLKAMEQQKKPATKPIFLDFEVEMPKDTGSTNTTDTLPADLSKNPVSNSLPMDRLNTNKQDSLTVPTKIGMEAAPTDTVWITGPEAVYVPDSIEVYSDTLLEKLEAPNKGIAIKDSIARVIENKMPSAVTPIKNDTATIENKNANCTATASEGDIDLIAMLIKGEKDPDEAIDIVKKMVKLKCVSTTQIRKLGNLLTGDEARYNLLDLCYKYTLDQQQYQVLVNLLQDTYYINRFKAMLQ